VKPPGARGLDEGRKPELVEHLPGPQRPSSDPGEAPRRGIEVEDHLVREVDPSNPAQRDVQSDGRLVGEVDERRSFVCKHVRYSPLAPFLRHGGGGDPIGEVAPRALLEEPRSVNAVGEPLHR
jgi:hypothetical protein